MNIDLDSRMPSFFATDLHDYWNSISATVITLKCTTQQFGGSMY